MSSRSSFLTRPLDEDLNKPRLDGVKLRLETNFTTEHELIFPFSIHCLIPSRMQQSNLSRVVIDFSLKRFSSIFKTS